MADDKPDFDALMCRIKDGDRQAFATLVQSAQIPLRSFLALRLMSLDHLDDVEQATWVTCYQNRAKYIPGGNALAWIMGIARNLARQHLRQIYRHQHQDDEVLAVLFEESLGNTAPQVEPDTAVIQREVREQVQDCLSGLAPASRQLIVARYFADKSVSEIAEDLGRSANWVSVTLMRVRKSLSACLERKGVRT